jgi:hypothetical protein
MSRFTLAFVVIVGLLATALLVHGRSSSAAVPAARSVIGNDARFANGPTAGATFASVSARLLADGQACTRRLRRDDPRCTARMAAAAYASVVAPMLVNCTQPGVYEARHGLDTELKEIALFDARVLGTAPAPTVPALPTC